MQDLLPNIDFKVPETLYIKNPKDSHIGQILFSNAVELIAEMGIEQFTILKLAKKSGCTEATVYRYWENKHNLLLYIVNYFWSWQECNIVFGTSHIKDPIEKMHAICRILSEPNFEISNDEKLVQQITQISIQEVIKLQHSPTLKSDLKNGSMVSYLRLHHRIYEAIKLSAPNYLYAESLTNTLITTVIQELYFEKNAIVFMNEPTKSHGLFEYLISLLPSSN